MARNYSDLLDEEKVERILKVADHMIQTGDSTRKTAEYITSHYFPISNATVHDYVSVRLPLIDRERYLAVYEVLHRNKPKTIDSIEVRRRVISAAKLIMNHWTIIEVSHSMNETYDTIYDDLTSRLPKINPYLAVLVANRLRQNRLDNLSHSSKRGL